MPPAPKDDMRPLPRGQGLLGATGRGSSVQCCHSPWGQGSPVCAPWALGSRGTQEGRRQSSRQRGNEPPPQGSPPAQPRGDPLEVLRRPQPSREGPGAGSAGAAEWTSPPPEGTGAPHTRINTHHTAREAGACHSARISRVAPPWGGPGPPALTISEAVLGLAPSGEPPSSREQSGPASSSYSVRQSDSSPGIGEQGEVWGQGPPIPGPVPPSWGPPWPLTIGTAVGNVARGRLNPGHYLCQVGEARAGEGQHLWSAGGGGGSAQSCSVRGCGFLRAQRS